VTEHQIIKGCKKGDRKAQAELYNQYRAQLFGVCLRYASDHEEAKDWLQDGFIQIYKDLYQYKPTGPLGGWMRRVMINVALQHIRKKKRLFPIVEINQVAENYETTEDLFSHFRAKALMKMVQQLPDGYRAVFNLYVIEGYSHKEIAQKLGVSEATSKSQLSRAKMTLRKLLEEVV
jgi:RNA polymerase sigma-70 factor (ECF subfamily)